MTYILQEVNEKKYKFQLPFSRKDKLERFFAYGTDKIDQNTKISNYRSLNERDICESLLREFQEAWEFGRISKSSNCMSSN